ncbi:SusC/RagA family TonB-linked outer membrane protein [Rhodocaloribacter litoris]|uniref:SusC/RagA family TonB-linked outer membrane protein n=1 Tax=Rhodocaloribacter litoris TaxID=2558931 RepID=UPI0014201FA6|nr:SusC/RagA family TonB-linked outer membrane protein [Rhodocaloribacter litoris]QXD15440.1 SusC/RagA family TonB-linked outer membrane protein [Rhodocaloribacter litoris]
MRATQFLLFLLLLAGSAAAPVGAQHTVRGQVTDREEGTPLPGVNIVIRGTDRGTATGVDGTYRLQVPAGRDTLVFSFVGYVTQLVPVDGREVIDVALVPDVQVLENIVVVGYVAQRERNLSGAVTTVDVERLEPVGTTTVNQLLQGRAPGLNLQTRSAQPGGGVSVNIRGAISPRGNNTPLYVIDGVPVTEYTSSVPGLDDTDLGFYGGIDRDPLSFLNPEDIASVTVLKDASAAAIYGSAAANGVVLITTRSGRAGRLRVNYRGSFSAQTPYDYFPLMNARQFMQEQNRLAYERYLFENRIAPYGTTDPNSVSPYIPLFTEQEMQAAGEGTDWLGLITENGHIHEHNLSLSGGSATTTAYVSFNLQDNDAVLKNSGLRRYSGRVNLDQTVSDRVRLRLRMSASRLEGNNASTGANSGGQEKFNMIQAAMAYSPTVPVFEENGEYASTFNRLIMNPAAFLAIDDRSRTTSLFATPTVEVDLTDQLRLNVVGQAQSESTVRGFYLPRTTNNAQFPEGMAQKSESTVENYSAETYLTYTNQFGPSSLTVVGGAGYYRALTEGSSMQGVGFFTDAFSYNNLGVSTELLQNRIGSWKTARTKLSQFARLNYSLHDRYILSLVARRDGSSIFAENHQWGFFPGISAAWIVSDEAFLRDVAAVTQLKVRAGYGQAGNESILSGNALQLYSPGYPFLIGNTLYNGVALSQVANPDLRWETVSTFNVGVDFGLWANRVRGSVDYFVKTARDLLDFNPLPSNNAVGRVADNVGATRSRGFEIELHTRNVEAGRFAWETDVSVSHYKSFWVERNPQVPLAPYIGENDPLDAIYGWQTDGIIRSETDRPAHMPNANVGNLRYVDQNGDGVLDEQDVVILGNAAPRWVVGFNNTFTLGGFDLNVYLYGNLGYKRNNNFAPNTFVISQPTNPENTTIYARDVWSSTNPDGTFPGIATNPYNTQNPTGNHDFNLKDAGFLRLRNVSLGYTVPGRLLGTGSPLQSARLFVTVQDLAVFTSYPGFDPEFTEPNPYPKAYTTTFGLELNF